VIREGISSTPASNPKRRFLIATDRNQDEYDEKTAHLDDVETIAREVLEYESDGFML
jgi:hypothetical protein